MSIVRAATMITRDRLGQSALIENVAQVRETDLRNDEDAHVAEFRDYIYTTSTYSRVIAKNMKSKV